MGRPSKRALQSREAGSSSSKRVHTSTTLPPTVAESPAISTAETCHVGEIPAEIFEVQIPGAWPAWSEAEDDSENSESDSDLERDATVMGYKDRELAALPVTIGQPVNGWQEAENLLSGKALKSDTSGACWARKNRAKMRVAKDKEKQDALWNTYGSIARFFVPVIPAAPLAVLRSSGSRFIAPDFDEPESQDLEKEMADDIEQLEMWLKKNKPDLTTPWGKRIDSLLRLLKRQRSRILLSQDKTTRIRHLVEDSEGIAVEIDKGRKYAKCLRRWKRDWTQSRTLPPKLRVGSHVKCDTLYEDEGVLVAVREYLNKVKAVTPKGVCHTVCNLLQSRRVSAIVGIETLITATLEGATSSLRNKGISLSTAKRWLGTLGWIYSRDGKGYVDGHEREDVEKYRETVFIPRWLVSGLAMNFRSLSGRGYQ